MGSIFSTTSEWDKINQDMFPGSPALTKEEMELCLVLYGRLGENMPDLEDIERKKMVIRTIKISKRC